MGTHGLRVLLAGWVLGAWGVLLALDAWNVYFRPSVTEEDIDRELRKQR